MEDIPDECRIISGDYPIKSMLSSSGSFGQLTKDQKRSYSRARTHNRTLDV